MTIANHTAVFSGRKSRVISRPFAAHPLKKPADFGQGCRSIRHHVAFFNTTGFLINCGIRFVQSLTLPAVSGIFLAAGMYLAGPY